MSDPERQAMVEVQAAARALEAAQRQKAVNPWSKRHAERVEQCRRRYYKRVAALQSAMGQETLTL